MNFGFTSKFLVCLFFIESINSSISVVSFSNSLSLVTDVFVGIFEDSIYLYFQSRFCIFLLSSIFEALLHSSAFFLISCMMFKSSLSSSLISFIKSILLCTNKFIISSVFSLLYWYTNSIQSKYEVYLPNKLGFIFSLSKLLALYISNIFSLSFKAFSKSFDKPVIINFSFALVNATYSTLISSDIVSSLDFILIASFDSVLYSIFFCVSINCIPIPIS